MSDFEARPFELTAKDTEGKVKEVTERLEAGVRELFESERYQAYLKAMSKFHDYSLNNTLLILMQKPDASLVAGFGKWRDDFERHVKRGEKGIKIFAPAPYTIKKEAEKIDPDTGQPVIDADGKPVMEQQEIKIPAFKVVSVFDVSQTDGKEIPDLSVDALTGSVEQYEDFWRVLKEVSPVPVELEKIEGGAHGYYSLTDKRIAVDEGMSELQTIKTLIHEIAHAKLHDIDLNAPTEEMENRPNRRTREVEAESIAFTVCQHFGLDTSDYSFGYVAGWSSDKEIKELKASLETIRTTASALITEIEERLQALSQQRQTAHVQGILDKIRSTGMGGISADDPQAVAKLVAKLSKLEEAQETMKAVNAYYRKHKTLDGCPHLTPEQIDKLKADMAQSWHLDKSRPYQSFVLSNNNAEIRRIRARIEQVRQHEDTQFAGWEFDGGRVEANKADNRLQIFFDGKPDEGTRDELKANGFRWAPSVGAWQRQLNMNAYRAAEHISCIQPVTGDKPVDLQRNNQHQQEAATPDALMTGERITTPRGSFHVTGMTREQMEAAGYGYHHSSEDGKYLIMGNGTQAYAIAAEQRVPENYMRTAELTTEQNYNMIDGRINNTPSVDELEEKAKRGEVISLSALAAAVKAEDGRTPQRSAEGKKPSIRAQLKADRAQAAAKPKQKEKEQEARRSVRQALEME